MAQKEGVQIHSHDVIYRFQDDVKSVMSTLLPPAFKETVVGEAKTLQVCLAVHARSSQILEVFRRRTHYLHRPFLVFVRPSFPLHGTPLCATLDTGVIFCCLRVSISVAIVARPFCATGSARELNGGHLLFLLSNAQVFEVSGKNKERATVAGLSVSSGKLSRSHYFRVVRDEEVLVDRVKATSMRIHKDPVNEVTKDKVSLLASVQFPPVLVV